MPKLDELSEELIPETQNVPGSMRQKAILDATRTLCQRTAVWRVTIDGMFIHGAEEVDLDIPKKSSVVKAHYITKNGTVLVESKDFSIYGDGLIILKEVPSKTESVKVTVSLKPSPDADLLDDGLWNMWGEVILHGALYNLKSMHGREWFESQIALYHQQQFELGLGRASHHELKAYMSAPNFSKGKYI